ncbi:MAG TPA: MiaB/RimO family radical SAM methylthiotransferase, partial [Planctomycetaceae bacterium]|nr:MiaB/RimO family radical SAM methylthiotransferase [Planctomycetaceae bacterium]
RVVPNTRGPEQGRPPAMIVDEARVLAEQGCLEITLLGQTVNSYSYTADGETTDLAALLAMLHEVEEIKRIKFVTNYPKDMGRNLLETIRDLDKVSPYLHVPLQHGNNDVLQRMKRGYTVEDYRDMMHRIWDIVPDAAISSDFIVGFCGETDAEFQTCIDSIREYRFKNSFIFKYSERAGTKAQDVMIDDVPYDVKQARNNELLEVQNEISETENIKFIGKPVEVLVEGRSKKSEQFEEAGKPIQMVGRTHCDRIVVFEGNDRQAGQILPVTIFETTPFTMFGTVVTEHVGPEVFSL